MSREQVSLSELLLSLDSSELQEAEQVRAAVNQQLSTDRGGAVLSSLVEYYLDTWSSQAVVVLSSIREPHHKLLLEKLNESLNRPETRLAGLSLLGHLIRKQPPWIHHVSHSALLPSLLRCLKTDTDVIVLITGVLVLITLLPMIPQAGKQRIYEFFDVFGRLASWSYKNPGHVPVVYLVHLHAVVYSLFHRLYGMFPCNFVSYLRLHYSMKENLDTFHEVVKPMLEHVRVHPELVTGTQDYELDPSRWRCYEVHDIVIECSRFSLDPLESSCEDDIYSSTSSSPRPPTLSSPLPHLDLSPSPYADSVSSSDAGSSVCPSGSGRPLTLHSSYIQTGDLTWSHSSHCGLSTPPPEPAAIGPAHQLSRTPSISGTKCVSAASVPVTPQTEDNPGVVAPPPDDHNQVKLQPTTERERTSFHLITEDEERDQSDFINSGSEEIISGDPHLPVVLTSTPSRDCPSSASSVPPPPSSLCFTPPHPSSTSSHRLEDQRPAPPYEPLFELALPQAATLFIRRKTQEALEKAAGQQEKRGEGEERHTDHTSVSPLEALDQMIVHGHDAHERLSMRLSAVNKPLDRSHFGGKQQSIKSKGPAPADELQFLRSQLLLVHGQLQYERFKRQQHAIRNRRLLRRVINTTALEEQSVAMKAQLAVQDEEIRSLKRSLEEEHRRYIQLQQDTHKHTKQLQTHIQQLLLRQQEEQRENQRLQSELQECQSRLRDLEAELQRANNKAYNAEHQLTQLSLKLCSSEQLQQQIFLLNQQLVLLRETNRALTERLEAGDTDRCTEASMLQCSVGKEYQRLKESEVLHRQKLEAANHRITELENLLAKKDQLILDQKKLLEDTKTQSRAELSACDSRCVALRRVTQTLQTEMLHLYSQVQLDVSSRPNSSVVFPAAQSSHDFCLQSSSVVINGGVEALSTSPLHLPSCSSSPTSLSPIDSPLVIGSYLEQQARQLFRPTTHGQEEEEEGEVQEDNKEPVEAQPESPPLGQEVEEATILAAIPETEPLSQAAAPRLPGSDPPAPRADLSLAVRQTRYELSIMDYDETLPEY
ncbi:Hamartin Tuberous sclerosis 1 protein [Channa argus]|uniref:Hamartin Tuberous sclerosis 1 protein n=1 Tax=Channa argus TaxID=215402 RepID=A0A6G1PYE5_CHAAH|nr:Hamartin Tuberous sclerosis 1 protein [Channa argus]